MRALPPSGGGSCQHVGDDCMGGNGSDGGQSAFQIWETNKVRLVSTAIFALTLPIASAASAQMIQISPAVISGTPTPTPPPEPPVATCETTPGGPTVAYTPRIFGTPMEGQTLRAIVGTWTNGPTTVVGFTYHWSGAGIDGAETYTAVPSDVGHTISLTVCSHNASGQTAYTVSTAAIQPRTPPAANCNGWASSTFVDGCANAPTLNDYSVYHPDFFENFARLSGQTYGNTISGAPGCKAVNGQNPATNCHPPWAVAGVDYPVGPNCSTADCGFRQPESATDPTNFASPNWHGNPGNCHINRAGPAYARWQVVCSAIGINGQNMDIGPFDWSAAGNPYGHGLSLRIDNWIGTCDIHDNYFVTDLDYSATFNANTVFGWSSGCWGGLTVERNTFRLRDDTTAPPTMDALWGCPAGAGTNGASKCRIAYWAGRGGGGGNRTLFHFYYNGMVNCPMRCLTVAGNLDARYNYFNGVNTYGGSGYQGHGDGWMTISYDGPQGFSKAQVCNCDGIPSLREQFDTWLVPNYGSGSTSCLSCALVNAPSGSTLGGTVAHTGDMSFTTMSPVSTGGANTAGGGGTFVDGTSVIAGKGWPTSRYSSPPWIAHAPNSNGARTYPRITGCSVGGVSGCSAAQMAACSPSTPCKYTTSVPMIAGTYKASQFGFLFPSTVQNVNYSNNVYVSNAVFTTGLATGREYCNGGGNAVPIYPCSAVQSMWWAGYGTYNNLTVQNNYVDLCGNNVGNYGMPVPCSAREVQAAIRAGRFGSSGPEVTAAQGGNVLMTTGQCIGVFNVANTSNSGC
jgi:hypothetical protein